MKDIFIDLVGRYSKDKFLADRLWVEIEHCYTQKKRYYHNLSHLDAIIGELKEYKNQILDWDTMLFSIFYHDIVYNVLRTDNEEKSAAIAASDSDNAYPSFPFMDLLFRAQVRRK